MKFVSQFADCVFKVHNEQKDLLGFIDINLIRVAQVFITFILVKINWILESYWDFGKP